MPTHNMYTWLTLTVVLVPVSTTSLFVYELRIQFVLMLLLNCRENIDSRSTLGETRWSGTAGTAKTDDIDQRRIRVSYGLEA